MKLKEYFDNFNITLPEEKIVQEFTKEDIQKFVETMNEQYQNEIKHYQYMSYNVDEMEDLFKLIDKIKAFQKLNKNYFEIKNYILKSQEASTRLEEMLKLVKDASQILHLNS